LKLRLFRVNRVMINVRSGSVYRLRSHHLCSTLNREKLAVATVENNVLQEGASEFLPTSCFSLLLNSGLKL